MAAVVVCLGTYPLLIVGCLESPGKVHSTSAWLSSLESMQRVETLKCCTRCPEKLRRYPVLMDAVWSFPLRYRTRTNLVLLSPTCLRRPRHSSIRATTPAVS